MKDLKTLTNKEYAGVLEHSIKVTKEYYEKDMGKFTVEMFDMYLSGFITALGINNERLTDADFKKISNTVETGVVASSIGVGSRRKEMTVEVTKNLKTGETIEKLLTPYKFNEK